MHLLSTVSLAVVAAASMMVVPPAMGQAAAPPTTSDLSSLVGSLPPCFITCATSSAKSVGCKGLQEDLPCVCSSATFGKSTQTCIGSSGDASCKSIATNETALMQGNQVFMGICKAVGVGMKGANGTDAPAGSSTSTSKNGANSTMVVNTSPDGKNSSTTTTTTSKTPAKDAALGMAAPPGMAQLASVVVALTVVLAGVSTLV